MKRRKAAVVVREIVLFSLQAYFEEGGRIEAGFRRHVHRADPNTTEEQVDILVCHGNVIRYFVCRALQLPPDAWLRYASLTISSSCVLLYSCVLSRFGLHNGSITMIHVRPSGRVGIVTMGETGHMPKEKLTFN